MCNHQFRINHDMAIGTAWDSEEDNEIEEEEEEEEEEDIPHAHDDQSDDRDDSDGYIHVDDDVVKLGPSHTFRMYIKNRDCYSRMLTIKKLLAHDLYSHLDYPNRKLAQ